MSLLSESRYDPTQKYAVKVYELEDSNALEWLDVRVQSSIYFDLAGSSSGRTTRIRSELGFPMATKAAELDLRTYPTVIVDVLGTATNLNPPMYNLPPCTDQEFGQFVDDCLGWGSAHRFRKWRAQRHSEVSHWRMAHADAVVQDFLTHTYNELAGQTPENILAKLKDPETYERIRSFEDLIADCDEWAKHILERCHKTSLSEMLQTAKDQEEVARREAAEHRLNLNHVHEHTYKSCSLPQDNSKQGNEQHTHAHNWNEQSHISDAHTLLGVNHEHSIDTTLLVTDHRTTLGSDAAFELDEEGLVQSDTLRKGGEEDDEDQTVTVAQTEGAGIQRFIAVASVVGFHCLNVEMMTTEWLDVA